MLERFGVVALSLGGVMILARYWDQDTFGTWVVFLAITNIIEVSRMGLLMNGLIKYLTDKPKEAGVITTASLTMNIALTGIVSVLLLGLAYLTAWLMSEPVLIPMLLFYILTTIALIPFFQFNFIQQANLDFRGFSFSNIMKQGVLFAFIAYMYFTGGEIPLMSLVVVQLVAAILASLTSYAFGKKYLSFSKTIDWSWVKRLYDYGKFAFGTNLSTMLYKSIDKLMLGAMLGTSFSGIYENAIKVNQMAEIPTQSIANLLFPQSARKANEGKAGVKLLYEKAVGAILAVLIPSILFVLIFADWIVFFLFGEKYEESGNLLRITILYGLFIPYAVQFGTVIDSMGEPKVNFKFTLLSMALNVIFNLTFIYWLGLYGAAYGTLLTYIVTFLLMQNLLRKKLNVNALTPIKYAFDFYKKTGKVLSHFIKTREVRLDLLQD